MEKWPFKYFDGELGDVPAIVRMRHGRVLRITIPTGELCSITGILYAEGSLEDLRKMDSQDKERVEKAKMQNEIKRVVEEADFEREEKIVTAFNKQIKKGKLLLSINLELDNDIYTPKIEGIYSLKERESLNFSGEILTAITIYSTWWEGGILEGAVISMSEGIDYPKGKRNRDGEAWEPLANDLKRDLYTVIASQPLLRWEIKGELIRLGWPPEMERKYKDKIRKGIRL